MSDDCTDHIGNGLSCDIVPGVCGDDFAQILCRRACGYCVPSPTATTPPPPTGTYSPHDCLDNVEGGMSCDQLPGVCADPLGRVICRKACGYCQVQATHATHTSHPTTTPPAPNVNCVDNLGGGLRCEHLPGVCNDAYSQVICRRACGFCAPAPNAPTPAEETMTLDECKDNVMYGLTCDMLPGVCGDTYGQIYCRRSCGNCTVTTTTAPPTTVRHTTHPTTTTPTTTPTPTTSAPDVNCVDNLGGGLRCEQLPGVCNDAYSQVVCRRACGFSPAPGAPTPPEEPMTLDECKDNVMNGLTCNMLPGVCEDTYGQIYCRKSCGNCTDGTEMTLDDCVDNLMYGVHCYVVPGVCSSQYGQIYCRRFCNTCHTTTQVPTRTTTATTLKPTSPPTTVSTVETCFDRLGAGLRCENLPGVCSDPYARVVCARACEFCKPNPYAPTTPPVTTEVMTLNECKDNVVNGLTCGSLPGVCNDVYGQIYCRKSCGNCTVTSTTMKPTTHLHTASPSAATTTTASTVETCIDNLGGGLMCQQLPGVCNDQYSRVVCRRSCGFCTPNPNAATTPSSGTEEPMTLDECKDNVMYGLSCNMLPGVCEDTYGQIYCRKSCGNCTVSNPNEATTPQSGTEQAMTLDECKDNVMYGLECNMLPGVCGDPYGQIYCRKTCGNCTVTTAPPPTTTPTAPTTTKRPEPCEDHIGNGLYCDQLPNVCADQWAQIVCRRTCNFCTPTPYDSTSTRAPNPSEPSSLDCADHLDSKFDCSELPNVCLDEYGKIFCRKTCGGCQCEDKIQGLTCQDLVDNFGMDPCKDALGDEVCPRFCGFCNC
ncbi:hypothetical protein BaRGS_00011063, partial [Batillaria attramentaria]